MIRDQLGVFLIGGTGEASPYLDFKMPICRESETEVVSDLQPMILNKLFPAESEAELSERTSHVYSPALFTRSLQNDRRPQPCEMVVHEGVWQLLIIHIGVHLGKDNHVESTHSCKDNF